VSRGIDAWVLFDGACGFCSRWVPFWGRLLAAHGIGIAPLQERWVRERLGNLDEGLLDNLRVLESGGKVHSGADAYRFAFRRIPLAWPFDLVSRIPVGRGIFDASYRAFARNRYRFSQTCGLGSRPGER
jgi:predicted DCC family thiol-disulfide oxidoreductase YuxK